MKKIIIVLCAVLLFTGCSCSLNDNKPEEAVTTFFEKYRNKDVDIIKQLKDTIDNEFMTDEAKVKYQELMEKQYNQFAYVIKDVKENNDTATATVELTVLNFRDAVLKAEDELKAHPEKFTNENGKFSEDKYAEYKMKLMDDVKDTVVHTIEVSLTKDAGIWRVDQLSSDDISKLHGLY